MRSSISRPMAGILLDHRVGAERNASADYWHIIDLMLAHVPEGISGSEGAYNSAALLDRRRELAEEWGRMVFGCFAKPEKMLGYPSR